MNELRKKRLDAGLTLNELAKALGGRVSVSRLSLMERGLYKSMPSDEQLILAVIKQIAPVSQSRRRVAELATKIDFRRFTTNILEGRATACAR